MSKVIIIAEAGVNHNGSYDLAKQLVDAAAQAGADYVKFQTFKATKIVSISAKKADYQMDNCNDGDDSQFQMLKNLEMPEQWHWDLAVYANQKGISFLSTGFDEASIDLLNSVGIPFFKIPSGEITNKPYIEHIAKKGKPIVLSTGMADMEEIRQAISIMEANGVPKEKITVLHCNTEYPTPFEDVNLLAMQSIKHELGVSIGYSDHTNGIEVPIAAVAMGATIIEKHFTLNRQLPGPDHKASLEPDELRQMVSAIRNIELATAGDGIKKPSASELKNKSIVRKSLYFNKNISSGHIITREDLIALRPGDGISPMEIDTVIGREIIRSVSEFDKVDYSVLI